MTDGATCTLCDLPLSATAVENDAGERFCCQGCRKIKSTLDEREDLSADADLSEIDAALDDDERDVPDDYETTFLSVDGMHCATCETFIESQAAAHDNVADADASYITDAVRVDHDPDEVGESGLRELLSGLGYQAYSRDDPLAERRAEENNLMRLVVGVTFGMAIMMTYVALIYPLYFGGLWYPDRQADFLAEMLSGTSASYPFLVMGLLTGIVLVYTGGPILKGAYVSLVTRQPNMDLLIAVAATSAWLYSTIAIFVESGIPSLYYDVTLTVILVVTAGGYYENQIKQKANERLAGLTEAQVEDAHRYESDGSTTTVAVDELAPGGEILVKEGERVPVDGEVVEGTGTVDEAVVTGESLPVGKTPSDEVVGGALLQDGSLVVEVGESAGSSIDRLTDMVWDLQSANHGIQQLADRLATIFVPLVLTLAATVGVVYFLLGASLSTTILTALTVMIVSCPCALGLATPLAIASSVREALERSIVVFDETIFERLQDVDVVIFDKTGTLTTGDMEVLDTEGPTDLFEQAALLETHSSHPVAAAIASRFGPTEAATDGGVAESPGREDSEGGPDTADPMDSRVTDFESYATGVGGTVDGTELLVGTVGLFAERGWTVSEEIERRAEEATTAGNAPVVVGRDGTAEGIAVVGDQPREDWEEVIEMLDERGVEVAVLTGDSEEASATFAAHPGVDDVFAGVPPEAKAETVRRYGAGKQTVMVGDGTNDAPALATADLGIALGSGTALAADAADVAIVDDSLSSLETVFDLAAAANSRVKQNIGWAFCYNGVAIPLAITGLINPLFAAIAMAFSSLLVVTNSSRSLL
ncbi:heavy metal translocating P-type ATPase [Halovenus sp. HT40]|uniref:heavy metal translocating P-type ATPase n=1 Tax=Halovenus sp. HT40 TaxID=3126691 RepID=UPI00300EF6FD